MISAKVVADSKNEFGDRITTMVVTMPRMILAEFNTHRMFSRNSASSRAIPFKKMVKSIEENPFVPIAWQKEHKGMQGTEYFTTDEEISMLETNWGSAKQMALMQANYLNENGTTKQLANRLLEPFMWHTVIVTATEWENFFALRCPQYHAYVDTQEDGKDVYGSFRSRKEVKSIATNLDKLDFAKFDELMWLSINKGQAEIHMMALAEAMWDTYQESKPKELKAGEWHIPYEEQLIDKEREDEFLALSPKHYYEGAMDFYQDMKVKLSTVMCARTSYTVVGEDLKPLAYERMIEIHDEMAKADPKHMSPFEHCAPAMTKNEFMLYTRTFPGSPDPVEEDRGREVSIMHRDGRDPDQEYTMQRGWLGNFRGFKQYRKMIKGENII